MPEFPIHPTDPNQTDDIGNPHGRFASGEVSFHRVCCQVANQACRTEDAHSSAEGKTATLNRKSGGEAPDRPLKQVETYELDDVAMLSKAYARLTGPRSHIRSLSGK